MNYAAYSADVAQQMFGSKNFNPTDPMVPVVFIAEVDSQAAINPAAEAYFAEAPAKLQLIVQAVEADEKPPITLVKTPMTLKFWDPVRERPIDAPGIVHSAAKEELIQFAKAA
ncbi:hypothetical protein BH11PAT4_BH11PAT4_8340 [soil metagenome]